MASTSNRPGSHALFVDPPANEDAPPHECERRAFPVDRQLEPAHGLWVGGRGPGEVLAKQDAPPVGKLWQVNAHVHESLDPAPLLRP